MIIIFFIVPALAILIQYILKNMKIAHICNIFYGIFIFLFSLKSIYIPPIQSEYFGLDSLSSYFLLIESIIVIIVAIYQVGYFKNVDRNLIYYHIYFTVFVFSMSGFIVSKNLGLMWVFLEASTLSSTFMIDFKSSKLSTIAAWRYVFICTIGVAFSFIGILLLAKGDEAFHGSIMMSDLIAHASLMNPILLKMGFAFILLGMGTKMGLAPMHAWLPSAHSEGPAPTSALLSGTLLNVALLGIIRVTKITEGANLGYFAHHLLLIFGFISLIFSAAYMLNTTNYKKMLAYSSIENMGIISIALGLGPIGILAALIHVLGHSFSKCSLFLTSGIIEKGYHTKRIDGVRGLMSYSQSTGIIWMTSFFSLIGVPPFPIFISELLIFIAFIKTGHWVLFIIFIFLLMCIIFGMGSSVIQMSFGKCGIKKSRISLSLILGQIVLLGLMAILLMYIPGGLYTLLINAKNWI